EGGQAVVAEVREMVIRGTDAGADERGDAPPGAEIDIGVGEEHQARQVGAVVVDVSEGAAERAELAVDRALDGRSVAILRSDVAAQPVVEDVADADIPAA